MPVMFSTSDLASIWRAERSPAPRGRASCGFIMAILVENGFRRKLCALIIGTIGQGSPVKHPGLYSVVRTRDWEGTQLAVLTMGLDRQYFEHIHHS